MNAFKTQHIRDRYKIKWQQEYILGMVQAIGAMSTQRILDLCGKQSLMSPATAHKYLKHSVTNKLLIQKRDSEDKRCVALTISAKGSHFLEEVGNAHGRK